MACLAGTDKRECSLCLVIRKNRLLSGRDLDLPAGIEGARRVYANW